MRNLFRSVVLGLACVTPAATVYSGEPAGVGRLPPVKTVHLEGSADLARLRASNPAHYARAQKIMSQANQLCRPQGAQVMPAQRSPEARFQIEPGLSTGAWSCIRGLLKASNPPKFEITFKLDSTLYIALVTVTDDPPHLAAARLKTGP